MKKHLKSISYIPLLFLAGSALALTSCKDKFSDSVDAETFVTQRSDSITMIVSENGYKRYRSKTPLMEYYGLAKEPFTEYCKGVFVETFRDTTDQIESTLKANYAIQYEKRRLWEARGNVVATGTDGRTLYTEQLFWDEKTHRIYSNVTCKITQGDMVSVGEGFESDEKLERWEFRDYVGQFLVDVSPGNGDDEKVEDNMQPPGTAKTTTPLSADTGTFRPKRITGTDRFKEPERQNAMDVQTLNSGQSARPKPISPADLSPASDKNRLGVADDEGFSGAPNKKSTDEKNNGK